MWTGAPGTNGTLRVAVVRIAVAVFELTMESRLREHQSALGALYVALWGRCLPSMGWRVKTATPAPSFLSPNVFQQVDDEVDDEEETARVSSGRAAIDDDTSDGEESEQERTDRACPETAR